MKILLIGNICSGKTLIGNLLAHELEFPFYSLDDLRCEWSDGQLLQDGKMLDFYIPVN